MTYGAGIRAETSRIKQLHRTVEMNTSTALAEKTRLEIAISDNNVNNIYKKSRKNRGKEWDEHISTADDTRLIKIVRDLRLTDKTIM